MFIIALIIVISAGVIVFINQPQFGRTPTGKRLERVKNSPNYRDGKFRNISLTPQITGDSGFIGVLLDFLFTKIERGRPVNVIPVVKTDLHNIGDVEDVLVWFGHSSCFIRVDGKTFLIDPVFSDAASPLPFLNKAFKGTNNYQPDDFPNIDYLIITHDHWDHLDYPSIMGLKSKTSKVICPLGVGEHFEHWKFDVNQIVEMDWNEEDSLGDDMVIYCLPARHFSGRGLSANQSLWASFLIKTPDTKIFISGDGGYDTHFEAIGKRFGGVDLAIMEDGQYNKNWRYIHMLPDQVLQAIADLRAKKVLPVHNSKFLLAKHPWDEPLNKVSVAPEKGDFILLTPRIGELVHLKDSTQVFDRWWETVDGSGN